MSGGHWERYSAVLVMANRDLRQHLDEALRRLRLSADELDLAREHNRTLLALLDRSRRDTAVANRAVSLLMERVTAIDREFEGQLRRLAAEPPHVGGRSQGAAL
ncbi:MAG: hypothetical protein RJA36_3915 [Pseudomonadota bacterium]